MTSVKTHPTFVGAYEYFSQLYPPEFFWRNRVK